MQYTAFSESIPFTRDTSAAPYAELSDQELIARVLYQDESALGAIYDRYHRLIYTIALRITSDAGVAEEVVQDVFHVVWRAAGGFQSTGNMAAWLIGITRHRAIDATRSRSYRARSREQLLADVQQTCAPIRTDEHVERQILRLTMRTALAELPSAQRQVLDLAYYGGLTQREIATQLGVPLGTVKSRLRLGLEHLRHSIRQFEG